MGSVFDTLGRRYEMRTASGNDTPELLVKVSHGGCITVRDA